MTLLEVVLATSLLSVSLVAIMQVMGESSLFVAHTNSSTDLTRSVDAIVERISTSVANSGTEDATDYILSHPASDQDGSTGGELRLRERTSIIADPDGDTWGDIVTYRLQNVAGENPTNGVDDNGDGVIDERTLVVVVTDPDPNVNVSTTQEIASGVTALSFSRAAAVGGVPAGTIAMTIEIARYDRAIKAEVRRRVEGLQLRFNNF